MLDNQTLYQYMHEALVPMTNTSAAILVENLVKTFPGREGPVEAVRGLDLEVQRGECFGLLGPNGAGKTTTVEILEGLSQPTSGRVEVLGMTWAAHENELRRRIGVTLQETRLPEHSTVLEMTGLFRSFYASGPEPIDVLRMVALESKAGSLVETLSGGQQRRLAVALALVGDPDLLFFDEPTTGLDPQSRRQLWDVIRDLQGRGRTTVLTTHYMDEAERLCDRVAIVDSGKVIALGSPRELILRLGGEHIVEFAVAGASPAAESFASLASVQTARSEGDGYALTVSEPHRTIPDLLARLSAEGHELARLTTRQASLEDVFVALTGRHLRDNDEPAPAPARRGRRGRG
jgi:ABC-2 type transport system ATP-binding protein